MNKYIYDKITDILEENSIHISDFIDYARRLLHTRYYIEFANKDDNHCNFVVQSKWFNCIEDAKQWLKNTLDYINLDALDIFLMRADFDENGDYGDIVVDEEITAEKYKDLISKE